MARREQLIVDGYNMIGAWPPLVQLKDQDQMAAARDLLLALLSNYSAYHDIDTWVVFDAQFVPGISQRYQQFRLEVVFTGEGETADQFIEAMIEDRVNVLTNVTVATSDLAEQWLVFQKGALRKSANELWRDVIGTEKEIISENNDYNHRRYRRRSPWTSHQMKQLKYLLDNLSDQ
ncbi:DNA-binding protein [Aerococcus urinaehominis]|uniref:DNA-binding protein n=1 Tax=Aerococcus urinaehominis TaxID=128944 RepID=A0A0X8FL71_9LACT|nr:NYN domain-containing protein [Aerococcus urinaehominis]AMB99267.1 DNA-binding protein [Aerococcus urinaehominis]SDM47146.1 hypothetical protein SAMN04487985_11826 [Aerococcus urinaehominis]